MATRRGRNVANGVISATCMVLGVIICVVWRAYIRKFIDSYKVDHSSTAYPVNHRGAAETVRSLCWILGLFYVLPGLIGFISAFVKQKGVYLTHMVVSILAVVVMSPFAVIGMLAFPELVTTDTSQCAYLGTKCQCRVVAWVLTLIGSVLSGTLGCRRVPFGIIHRSLNFTTTAIRVMPRMIQTKSTGYAPLQVEYQPHEKHDKASV